MKNYIRHFAENIKGFNIPLTGRHAYPQPHHVRAASFVDHHKYVSNRKTYAAIRRASELPGLAARKAGYESLNNRKDALRGKYDEPQTQAREFGIIKHNMDGILGETASRGKAKAKDIDPQQPITTKWHRTCFHIQTISQVL
jgi:hypothetical protein